MPQQGSAYQQPAGKPGRFRVPNLPTLQEHLQVNSKATCTQQGTSWLHTPPRLCSTKHFGLIAKRAALLKEAADNISNSPLHDVCCESRRRSRPKLQGPAAQRACITLYSCGAVRACCTCTSSREEVNGKKLCE